MSNPVLIIGGGIGALTTALALLQRGIPVGIFEGAAAIGDVGAGITVGATASRGIYALGLARAPIRAAPEQPGDTTALHSQTDNILDGGFKDRTWKALDLGPILTIHRADLYSIPHEAVLALDPDALSLGHTLQSFEADDDGVTALFESGETIRGSALIGCDGVRSRVRKQLFGPEEPRSTGQDAYRFRVPMDKAAPFMGQRRRPLCRAG